MGLVKPLRSELVIFYLDDGTLGGGVEDVLHDLQTVAEEAARLGLQLNHSNSEVICNDPSARAAIEASAPLAADAPSQKVWDAPRVAASLKALQAAAPNSVTQARLLAACRN